DPHRDLPSLPTRRSSDLDRTLADVNGTNCRAYVEYRTAQSWRSAKPAKTGRASRIVTAAAARRELEDLRAAINHHRREGLCSERSEEHTSELSHVAISYA